MKNSDASEAAKTLNRMYDKVVFAHLRFISKEAQRAMLKNGNIKRFLLGEDSASFLMFSGKEVCAADLDVAQDLHKLLSDFDYLGTTSSCMLYIYRAAPGGKIVVNRLP